MPRPNEVYDFTVPDALHGERLDLVLSRLGGDEISRTRAQSVIKAGGVSVNGVVQESPKYKVPRGAVLHVDAPADGIVTVAEPEHIPLDVLYEDDAVLVVNKAAGMVVHPAAGNWTGTLVNALLGREGTVADAEEFDPLRPGIVHRLDKDTSGALVIAKTPVALRRLVRSFANREPEKTYLALVHGVPNPPTSVIHTDIGRHKTDRRKMAVVPAGHGREAYTAYRVLEEGIWEGIRASLLQVKLHTGRTHQIRVHMSHMGYPLIGDKLYNRGRSSPAQRQMLHAWKLTLVHPMTRETLSFEAPLPDDFLAVAESVSAKS